MSYSAMQDGVAVRPVAQVSPDERIAYIAKVYGLFFTGILAFFLSAAVPIVGLFLEVPVLADFAILMMSIPWFVALGVILLGTWVASLTMMTRGLNLVGFYMIAVMYGFLSISLIVFALGVGGILVLMQALGLTTLVMGSLTAYVFISRKDFGFMRGFLFVGMFTLLGAVVIGGIASSMGYPMEMFQYGLSIAFVLLFSGFVLHDTSNILHRYSTDMVVPAALALLIDFIALFRSLLFLLAARR